MANILEEKGVCFFAYNNDQLDYVELAVLAASYVKKYLKLPVCLITDEGSEAWLYESKDNQVIDKCFDYIITTNDDMKTNMRTHFDSPYADFSAQFNNSNKHKIYQYSPFEKTLLLDIDYIVKTDYLKSVFDYSGVIMFDNARDMRNDLPLMPERYLYEAGIKMWWSTVVYFDRSELSKIFFDTWAHVADNYSFYQYLYNFPPKLFRTDYCVSIASHILNGMQDSDVIGKFDIPIYNMSQKDDIVEVHDDVSWVLLANDTKEHWKNILCNQKYTDIHAMNKRALGRFYSKLMENLHD